jgi:hypothetical protein
MKKITYDRHKADEMFKLNQNSDGVFKRSNSQKQINKCEFPFDIDFCVNPEYIKPEKNSFTGSGIYLIEFGDELIYIGKFRPFRDGNIITTRWKPHLETLTNRGSHVGGFGKGLSKKLPYEKVGIFTSLKGCENSSLEKRRRDTGTVTSKKRLEFAKANWNIFRSKDINNLEDSLKKFTFYYFQLNEVKFFSFKNSSTKQAKELYGDLTSIIEEYLLIKYSTECNSGFNGKIPITDVKIADIEKDINGFVNFIDDTIK